MDTGHDFVSTLFRAKGMKILSVAGWGVIYFPFASSPSMKLGWKTSPERAFCLSLTEKISCFAPGGGLIWFLGTRILKTVQWKVTRLSDSELILKWFNNHFPKFGKVWCLSKMQIVWQLSQYHHLMGCYLELRWCSNTNNVSIQLNHQCNLFEGIILTCIDEAREVFFFQHILIPSEHFLLLVKLFFIYIQKSNKHESVKT